MKFIDPYGPARPGRNHNKPVDDSDSATSRFVRAITGNSRPFEHDPEAQARAEREHREWLEGVAPGLCHRFRSPAAAAAADRELQEWVDSITEAPWDSSKHPRGGYPQNAGWWSPGIGKAPKEQETSHLSPPSVLIAVDGTGSKDYREGGQKRGFDKATGRHRSHVRNFYEDYPTKSGEQKFYWDGPNETFGGDTGAIFDNVMTKIRDALQQNPDTEINLVGHSRGGYIAMEVARQLKAEKVKVNFLGLYDAVDSAMGFGRSETIPSNVLHSAHAMRSNVVSSRPFFNTADHGPEAKGGDHHVGRFVATHSAIGGAPWDGDQPRGMYKRVDEDEAIRVDQWMRARAAKAGVSLKPTPQYPYDPKESD